MYQHKTFPMSLILLFVMVRVLFVFREVPGVE